MVRSSGELMEISENMSLIPLHFDVPEHHLPLKQFIDAAKSTQGIIDNFNKEFFDNKLKYQIHVVGPQNGGLIELLQIIVPVGAPIWAFLCTDIGKAYIKGLTGNEPAFWAEKAGEKTKDFFADENGENPQKETSKTPEVLEQEQYLASILVVQIVLGFLRQEPDSLRRIGVSKSQFRSAYVAKNDIIQGCIDNKDVQGLGFDLSHDFPITRQNFLQHIVDLPEEIELIEETEWIVETQDIIVHSPNWKRDGRKWQAGTSKLKDIAFTMEDDFFWHHVKLKDINPDFNDNMKVQWAYPKGTQKPTNVRVLKVISYNGEKISKPLTNIELEAELQEFSIEEKNMNDLFD